MILTKQNVQLLRVVCGRRREELGGQFGACCLLALRLCVSSVNVQIPNLLNGVNYVIQRELVSRFNEKAFYVLLSIILMLIISVFIVKINRILNVLCFILNYGHHFKNK